MEIALGRYVFNGPQSLDSIEAKAGVYAILRHRGQDIDLLEVGESKHLQDRLHTHKHLHAWRKDRSGKVAIFVHYMPAILDMRRREIAQEIKEELAS